MSLNFLGCKSKKNISGEGGGSNQTETYFLFLPLSRRKMNGWSQLLWFILNQRWQMKRSDLEVFGLENLNVGRLDACSHHKQGSCHCPSVLLLGVKIWKYLRLFLSYWVLVSGWKGTGGVEWGGGGGGGGVRGDGGGGFEAREEYDNRRICRGRAY